MAFYFRRGVCHKGMVVSRLTGVYLRTCKISSIGLYPVGCIDRSFSDKSICKAPVRLVCLNDTEDGILTGLAGASVVC